MKIVNFTQNTQDIKEELLMRFDIGYPPAIIAYLLNEYNHKDYWIGKDISDFTKDLSSSEVKSLEKAVAFAKEIGVYTDKPTEERVMPHVVLWNRTDGTIRSLDGMYGGFFDNVPDFFRFLASRKDIMEKLTVNDVERRIFTNALSTLPDDTTDHVKQTKEFAFACGKKHGVDTITMGIALEQAKAKADAIKAVYPENPVLITCSLMAKALQDVVNKAIALSGEKGIFNATFTLSGCMETTQWRITEDF